MLERTLGERIAKLASELLRELQDVPDPKSRARAIAKLEGCELWAYNGIRRGAPYQAPGAAPDREGG